jgi:RHS repeat-associated protein
MTTVTRTSALEGVSTERYDYDLNKNLTLRSATGRPESVNEYGDYDRLLSVGGVAYEFDEDGFLSKRGADTFRYGVKGELLEASVGGDLVTYTYDALGRRTARADAEGATQYLYGNPLDHNLLTHSVDPAGVVTAYLYSGGGLLAAIERNGQRYYVMTDEVGTPERVLDSDGNVVKKLRYDSFGLKLSDSAPDFALEIGFAGGIEDKTTGLVRFGMRDYDPAAGRWTARDPIGFEGGQANLYAYVANNPISLRDPSGLSAWGSAIYIGIGGGLTYHLSPQGWRVCSELGFGVGGGITLNADLNSELPANESFTFDAGAQFSAGPFASLEVREVYDLNALSKGGSICSNTDFVGKGNVGPLTFDDEKGLDWNKKKPSDKKSAEKWYDNLKKFPWNKPSEWGKWAKNASGKAQIHAKFTICAGKDW